MNKTVKEARALVEEMLPELQKTQKVEKSYLPTLFGLSWLWRQCWLVPMLD